MSLSPTSTPQSEPGRTGAEAELVLAGGRALSPKEAMRLFLFVTAGILVVGLGLNHYLTAGSWTTGGKTIDSALGTESTYLTAEPYDVITLAVLLASLFGMGVGFMAPHKPSLASRWFAFILVAAVLLFLYPAVNAAAGDTGPDPALWYTLGFVFGFLALVWAVAHFVGTGPRMHLLRAAGFLLFSLYWASNILRLYAIEQGDWVNGGFAAIGAVAFVYMAYHELLSIPRHEDPRGLRWLAGAAFITTGVYVATHKVQVISEALIVVVAKQTTWLLQFFGQGVIREGGDVPGSMIQYPPEVANYFPIQIILACTAVQSIMIFVGAIFALQPPNRGDGISGRVTIFERLRPTYQQRRFFALLLTVPLIYSLNLFRNVIIIWMSADGSPWLFGGNQAATDAVCMVSADQDCRADSVPVGHPDFLDRASAAAFWFSHNVIGKGGSLVALVIIAFIVFQILPELYDSLIGLFDLKQRRGPLERYLGWGLPRRRRPAAPTTAPSGSQLGTSQGAAAHADPPGRDVG